MNFNLMRYGRIVGAVVVLLGMYRSNFSLMLLGDVLILSSFLWSVVKTERHIETQEEDNHV